MAERRLTAHQKELRKQYSREFANLKKRVKRLERTGYQFDYTFERVEQPTKRDIERIKKLRGKRLQQTGTHVDKWTGEVTEPKAGALKSVRSLTKRKPVKTLFGEEPFIEPPREEVEGTGETPEPDSIAEATSLKEVEESDLPIYENMAIMQVISTLEQFSRVYSKPVVVARADEFKRLVDKLLGEYGARRVGKILADLLSEEPDLLSEYTFYNDEGFDKSMEKILRAFKNADMLDGEQYKDMSTAWKEISDDFDVYEDYDE